MDWMTLPAAAEKWGVTRAMVHRMVIEGPIPASVISKAGDRWMLDGEFVAAVTRRTSKGVGVVEAVRRVVDSQVDVG